MEDYGKLIEQFQTGEIDALDFLLAQEDLAILYVKEMQEKGITPTATNAERWMRDYENQHLYQ